MAKSNAFGNTSLDFTVGQNFLPDAVLVPLEALSIIVKSCMSLRLIFCPLGIWANAMNIRTFLRMGLKETITVCFFALSLSDFAYNILGIGYTCINIAEMVLEGSGILPQLKQLLYHASIFFAILQNIFLFNTMYTTTFLAVQRCLCVLFPLNFKDILTRGRIIISLALMCLLPAGFYIMLMFSLTLNKMVDSSTNQTAYITSLTPLYKLLAPFSSYGFNICFPSICHITTVICVLILKYSLIKSYNFRNASSAAGIAASLHGKSNDKVTIAKTTKEKQAIVQVALVCAIQITTNMPSFVKNAVSLFILDFNLNGRYHNFFNTCNNVVITIESLNSVFNFFVYYNYSSRFRKLCFGPHQRN